MRTSASGLLRPAALDDGLREAFLMAPESLACNEDPGSSAPITFAAGNIGRSS